MGAGENECQISQNYILQWRIQTEVQGAEKIFLKFGI